MLRSVLPQNLLALVQSYRRAMRSATIGAFAGAIVASIVIGAHLSREGTFQGRGVGAALVIVTLGIVIARIWVQLRWSQSPEQAVRSIVVSTQPEIGRRILRALHLAERRVDAASGESVDLARLHYERMLSRASAVAVISTAKERARRFGRLAVVCFGGAALLAIVAPLRLVEGLDVALARNGVAPLDIEWLEAPSVESHPPRYLRQPDGRVMFDSVGILPEGTEVVVRAAPRFDGRELILTDGKHEQPFTDDGTGAVVARYEVLDSAKLRVAARFGDVLIYEPRTIDIFSQPDRAPQVELAGAPSEIALETMERLELHWTAKDDHSIVEVELVIRSAGKEDRRNLERTPGDKKDASGGYVLNPDDPFLQRLFLPATVRVEARDNDPREGSKWGQSEAFTIRPPHVGSPQTARYLALVGLRDRVVDFLIQLKTLPVTTPKERNDAKLELTRRYGELKRHADGVLGADYVGLGVPRGWSQFASGQLQKLDVGKLVARGQAEKAVAIAEQVALGFDGALQSLGAREAQSVSKQLANVADEAAYGARAAQSEKSHELGAERLDLAISVLDSGVFELARLGELGDDLGSVAIANLDRITRSRAGQDFFHAELAALHMAARLRRPNPSFGAKGGGGGGGGGVESGVGQSGGEGSDAQGQTSDAENEFDRAARELEQLSQEHAEAMDGTQNALREAEQEGSSDSRDEAQRRAEELRRSVMRLPAPGETPGTGRASAALAREHTGAMAHELERSSFEEAIESAHRAVSAAEDALRKSSDLAPGIQRELNDALDKVREHMRWAEEQLEKKQRRTEEAAREALENISELERELAERAKRLSQDESASRTLPKESLDRLERAQRLMQDAAERLGSGKGEQGLSMQRDAQRLLEQAKTGETSDDEEGKPQSPSDGDHEGGRKAGTGGDVPDPEKQNRAEEFRRRVLEGLKQGSSGRLSPAVQRYAEGLLR